VNVTLPVPGGPTGPGPGVTVSAIKASDIPFANAECRNAACGKVLPPVPPPTPTIPCP
jgi:hypothetical protein